MYPKMLYLEGWKDVNKCMVARSPEHEKELRKQGYKDIEEFAKKRTTRKKA